MSNKASKEEILDAKLKKAFNLIKNERYGAARQILRDLSDNPKAQAMLKLMEGKVEKRQGFSAISKSTLLMLGTVTFVLCIMIACGLLFIAYFSQYTPDELFLMAMAIKGDEDAAIMAVALNYCKLTEDFRPNSCQQWPLEMFIYYPTISKSCFSPYSRNFLLDDTELEAIRLCLRGFSAPWTY